MFDIKTIVDKLVSNPKLLFDLINTEHASPLSLAHLEDLPDLPGIYFVATTDENPLERFDQIIYIGVSTKSIYQRWRSHHKMPIFRLLEKTARDVHQDEYTNYDRYIGIFCWVNPFADAEFLMTLENELINRIKPCCNRLQMGKDRDSFAENIS